VFFGGHNILVAYTNGKARVWNTETGEFRRSTAFDAAEEMVNEGEWEEVCVEYVARLILTCRLLSSNSGVSVSGTAISSLQSPLPGGSDASQLHWHHGPPLANIQIAYYASICANSEGGYNTTLRHPRHH